MILRVDGIPAPKGSARAIKRGGFAVLVASSSNANRDAQKSWADAVAWAAKADMDGESPLTGPIVVRVTFYLPRPKSVTRAHHTVKPDLDKILRCTLDALTGIVIADDAQVVTVEPFRRECPMKMYADAWQKPGATIQIYQLPAEPARSKP